MTDKPTPTDAELKAMWQLHAADIGGIFYYARAVLAKWGQPAQAAEPFCWHWENTFNGGTGTVKKNPETLGINMSHPDYKWTALYTAPQPSPTAQSADSVREDAARYRWLREGNDAKHGAAWHVAVNLYGCEWDAAIDAATKQGANHDN